MIVDEIKNLILSFLSGNYEPADFSVELPHKIVDNYNAIESIDSKLAERLDDMFPDICAEYERGDDPEPFRKKVREEYERIFKQKAH